MTISYKFVPADSYLELFDLSGRKLFHSAVEGASGNMLLETAKFPSGIYILILRNEDGLISQQKLIIE